MGAVDGGERGGGAGRVAQDAARLELRDERRLRRGARDAVAHAGADEQVDRHVCGAGGGKGAPKNDRV